MNTQLKKRALAAVAALAVTGLLCSCSGGDSAKSADSPIRVGVLYPTSGDLATLGKASLDGAKIAVDMVNDAGGIGGRKVEIVQGNPTDASAAVSEATRLTTKEKVSIVTGTYASDLALAASASAIRNGAFYWESDAISDDLTNRKLKNFYQFPYAASANGGVAADLVKSEIEPVIGHTPKVVVTYNDSSYGALVGKGAVAEAQKNGFDVVGNFSYPTDTQDQSALALKISKAAPDVVIAASYQNDAVLLKRSLDQQGVKLAAFVGTGGIYGQPTFAQALGDKVNGIFDTEGSAAVPDSALSDDAKKLRTSFVDSWKKSHDGDSPTFLPTIAFDSMWVLLHDVVGKAKSDKPDDLGAAAKALDMPKGSTILGYGVKFNAAGLNTAAFAVGMQWQSGQKTPVVVFPQDLASAKPTNIPLSK